MKKFLFVMFVFLLAFVTDGFAQENYVGGGFEASGHMFVGSGWQRFATIGGTTAVGNTVLNDINGSLPGVIGEYADATGSVGGVNREDVFKFFIDEIELDLAKNLSETVRVRTDLDFGANTLNSGRRFAALGANVYVEQAFITTDIGVGRGLELLVGRFNSPFGVENNDTIANDTLSRSILFRALRPKSYTGAKFWYAFSDTFDWAVWVSNNGLAHDTSDVVTIKTDTPAFGTKLNFNWGDEGAENHVALSGVWGSDQTDRQSGRSFLGDLEFLFNVTDVFAVKGEGIWRQINTLTFGQANGKYYGGLLNFHYDFSDTWFAAFRYAYAHDVNGPAPTGALATNVTRVAQAPIATAAQSLTGGDQQLHEAALAFNFKVTEGADFRLEGGYTFIDPAGVGNNEHVFGVGAGFAYAF